MTPKAERRWTNPSSARPIVGVPAGRVSRYWCVDCRVEFDVGERAHALHEISRYLPSAMKAVAGREARDERVVRHSSGYRSIDRVFGGGMARGSCTLLTGVAGVGKSTLLIQILMNIAAAGGVAVYVSGEESRAQVMERALAIGPVPPNLVIVSTQSWEVACRVFEQVRPHLIVVDSIQRMATIRPGSEGRGGQPGTHSQVVAMAQAIVHLCKKHPTCWSPIVVAVGHLNAAGHVAGPEAAKHDLDAHVHMSKGLAGEIYVASGKNRYGASGELGSFRFQGKRLVEMRDLSTSLLAGALGEPGAVAFPSAHLARVIVAPIESVVSAPRDPKDGGPRLWRAVGSLSDSDLRDILHLLRTHGGLDFSLRDVRVHVPRIADTDLSDTTLEAAVAVAVLSSAESRPPCPGTAYHGKFTLTGKLRPAERLWDRMLACAGQGIRRVVGPPVEGGTPATPPGTVYVPVPDLRALVEDFRRTSPIVIGASVPEPPGLPESADSPTTT
jgi:DNA repair protein RadA/Sms